MRQNPTEQYLFSQTDSTYRGEDKMATILQNKFWYDFPVRKYYILDLIPPKSVPTHSIKNNA